MTQEIKGEKSDGRKKDLELITLTSH